MQYPYTFEDLVPLDQRTDEEGWSHAIYRLPARKNWTFRRYINEDCKVYVDSVKPVIKVRVSLGVDETGIPTAVVIPFDETGNENRQGTIFLDGAVSFHSVLSRLGFAPSLSMS
jgi:hypothetical protein